MRSDPANVHHGAPLSGSGLHPSYPAFLFRFGLQAGRQTASHGAIAALGALAQAVVLLCLLQVMESMPLLPMSIAAFVTVVIFADLVVVMLMTDNDDGDAG